MRSPPAPRQPVATHQRRYCYAECNPQLHGASQERSCLVAQLHKHQLAAPTREVGWGPWAGFRRRNPNSKLLIRWLATAAGNFS